MKAIINTKLILEDSIIFDGAITFDNGVIDGDSFHFNITMKLPFGIMPLEITGTLQADGTLAGESAMPMGVSKFTAVKVD